MKIYEKPLMNVKTFDVEDIMAQNLSGTLDMENPEVQAMFQEITGDDTTAYKGVVFEW